MNILILKSIKLNNSQLKMAEWSDDNAELIDWARCICQRQWGLGRLRAAGATTCVYSGPVGVTHYLLATAHSVPRRVFLSITENTVHGTKPWTRYKERSVSNLHMSSVKSVAKSWCTGHVIIRQNCATSHYLSWPTIRTIIIKMADKQKSRNWMGTLNNPPLEPETFLK